MYFLQVTMSNICLLAYTHTHGRERMKTKIYCRSKCSPPKHFHWRIFLSHSILLVYSEYRYWYKDMKNWWLQDFFYFLSFILFWTLIDGKSLNKYAIKWHNVEEDTSTNVVMLHLAFSCKKNEERKKWKTCFYIFMFYWPFLYIYFISFCPYPFISFIFRSLSLLEMLYYAVYKYMDEMRYVLMMMQRKLLHQSCTNIDYEFMVYVINDP